ncbi:MAG TPA: SDR family oxidoreductase [Actinomycetota bacterium]|nr:SDR family oxidoreductase [Actinomycetota bacterium]
MSGLLEGKNCIIYGAGGGIGSAVAQAFAREGATVFLAGRTESKLQAVADAIAAGGGRAEVAVVDALDERAVEDHVAHVVEAAGSVDVSFNLIDRGDVQGQPVFEMSVGDMLRAVTTGLQGNFITARAAARRMIVRGGGVILHLNSASGDGAHPGMGSTGPADAATESFMRYLAAETGPFGVRVCGIWTAGVEETLTRERLFEVGGDATPDPATVIAMISSMSALRRCPKLDNVCQVATFLASDRAAGITGSMTNVTAGLVLR